MTKSEIKIVRFLDFHNLEYEYFARGEIIRLTSAFWSNLMPYNFLMLNQVAYLFLNI